MKRSGNEFRVLVFLCVLAFMDSLACAQDCEPTQVNSSEKDESRVYEVGSRTHVKLGGFSAGAGYARYSSPISYGPYLYPGYAWDFGDYPWETYHGVWSPFSYPPMQPGIEWREGKGEVKLESSEKEAEVYINGAYAGLALELKSIWLDSGVYDLELRKEGYKPYQKRIYILSGKALKITAGLDREPHEVAP